MFKMIEITLILVLIFLVVFLTFATHESVTSFIQTKKMSKLKNSEPQM